MGADLRWRWIDAIESERGPAGATDRQILVCIALRANPDGSSCFPSEGLIAQRTGRDRTTVQRTIKRNVKAGWLRRYKGSHRSFDYELTFPGWFEDLDQRPGEVEGAAYDHPGDGTGPPQGRQDSIEGAAQDRPTYPLPPTYQSSTKQGFEEATLTEQKNKLAKLAQDSLGGGAWSEKANRRWLKVELPRGSRPDELERAILGLRHAIDAGVIFGIDPGSTASLKALDRRTDGGRQRAYDVALEHYDRFLAPEPTEEQRAREEEVRNLMEECCDKLFVDLNQEERDRKEERWKRNRALRQMEQERRS